VVHIRKMNVLTKFYMEIQREEATLDAAELYLQSPHFLVQ
jgi:hypothetical protein